jgi:hypothetical protein
LGQADLSGHIVGASGSVGAHRYYLADESRPWSIIRTQTEDSAIDLDNPLAVPESTYIESYAHVDGFGRTITTMTEADPDPTSGHDGGAWIVGGLLLCDAKSAVQRKSARSLTSTSTRRTTTSWWRERNWRVLPSAACRGDRASNSRGFSTSAPCSDTGEM